MTRSTIFVLAAVMALIVAGWSGAWFYGARVADEKIDAFFAREAQTGRKWTCRERATEGFPLALRVACRQPSVEISANGRKIVARLAGLTGGAAVWRPEGLVNLISPLDVEGLGDNQTLHAEWSSLEASAPLLAGRFTGANLSIDNVALTLRAADGQQHMVRTEVLRLRVEPASGHAPEERAFAADVSVKGLADAAIDRLARSVEPIDLSLQIYATQIAPAAAQNMADRIEAWRNAGGRIEATAFQISKGPAARVAGAASLGLDPSHRPQGDVTLDVVGMQDAAAAFGVPSGMARLGGALGSLLQGAPNAKPIEPGATRLSLKLHDGLVFLGPIALPQRLAPLY